MLRLVKKAKNLRIAIGLTVVVFILAMALSSLIDVYNPKVVNAAGSGECSGYSGTALNACKAGYTEGYRGVGNDNNCKAQYPKNQNACEAGFQQGLENQLTVPTSGTPSAPPKATSASTYCGTGSNGLGYTGTGLAACEEGYNEGAAKSSSDQTCKNKYPANNDACDNGFLGTSTSTTAESAKFFCTQAGYSGTGLSACEDGYTGDSKCASKFPQNQDACNQGYISNPSNYASCTSGSGTNTGSTSATSGTGAIGASANNCSGIAANTCDNNAGPFAWFICAALSTLTKAENSIISVVQSLLTTNTISFTAPAKCADPNNNSHCTYSDKISALTYKTWSEFRLYGDILLVLALLASIIIEAAGGGSIAEAYTVKRMIPRILTAAILINLSIYLVFALEDIANILGNGIQNLIQGPFKAAGLFNAAGTAGTKVSGGAGLTITTVLGGVVLVAGFTEGIAGLLLLVIGGFLIAALGVLITIMIRQGLISVLALTSPIAFALYVLPNTEQWFKKWWDLLIKTLMVFPIVMAILSVSAIAGILISNIPLSSAGLSGNEATLLSQIMGILATAAPLFLIPFAFRMSGGVIGQASRAINNAANRAREPLNNLRKQNRQDRLQRASNGQLFRGTNRFAKKMNSMSQTTMMIPKAGFRPKKMRSSIRAAKSARATALMAKGAEDEAVAAVINNDDLLNAASYGDQTEQSTRERLQQLGQEGQELNDNVKAVEQARRAMGRTAFNSLAAAANAGTGTGYESGPAEMLRAITKASGGDKALAARTLAMARSNAERARRVDLYGAGFAKSADMMARIANNDPRLSDAQVNKTLTDEALKTKSAGEIASGRFNSFKNMKGAIDERIKTSIQNVNLAEQEVQAAAQSGDVERQQKAAAGLERAKHEKIRTMAYTASLIDIAGQVSPENAAVIGAVVGGETGETIGTDFKRVQATDRFGNPAVDASTNMPVYEVVPTGTRAKTFADEIEELRSNPEFQQYRREYGGAQAAAAAAGAAGGMPGGPGTPGGGVLPGGAPPNA